MIYVAEAKTLALKKITPIEPPNSGPNALLIITNRRTSQENNNSNIILSQVQILVPISLAYLLELYS